MEKRYKTQQEAVTGGSSVNLRISHQGLAQQPQQQQQQATKPGQNQSHEPSPEELAKMSINEEQSNKKGTKEESILQLSLSLPDGTLYKTAISVAKVKVAFDIVKLVCEKVQLSPIEDYELVEVLNDSEKAVPPTENTSVINKRIKDSPNVKLAIRKKNKTIRKISFMAGSRGTSAKASSSVTVNSNASTNGSKGDLGSSSKSPSQEAISPVSPPIQGNVRPRRLSIQEGLSALLGFGSKQDNAAAPETAPSYTDPVSIFTLEATERRILHLQIPEHVSKLFTEVDGHGLSFNRLAERGRFLSWSRSGSISAKAEVNVKVFGCQLANVMENEFLQDQSRKIPRFFQQCLDYLEDQALHIPGIFRISGTTKRIKSLKDDVDSGKELSFNDVKPHDVTGLLKMFFREMPEPLLTFKLYDFYISAAKNLPNDKLDDCIRYLTLLLPICNLYVLEAFLKLLDKIAANSGPPMPLTPFAPHPEPEPEPEPAPEVAAAASPPAMPSRLVNIFSPTNSILQNEDDYPLSHNDSLASLGHDAHVESTGSAELNPPVRGVPMSPSENIETLNQSEGNLMTPLNLAIVIAPNILRTKETKTNADKTLTDNDYVTKVFVRMLLMQESLFSVPPNVMTEVKQKMQS